MIDTKNDCVAKVISSDEQIEILRSLPRKLRFEAYKWFISVNEKIQLSTKGKVTKIAQTTDYESLRKWEQIRNIIRGNRYVFRLWKPFAIYYFQDCEWCSYFKDKCILVNCKYNKGEKDLYKPSIVKASDVFNVHLDAIILINRNLTEEEKVKFYNWIKENVHFLVKYKTSEFRYAELYKKITKSLAGHIKNKMKMTYNVVKYRGEDPEIFLSIIHEAIANQISRYDFTTLNDLKRICNRAIRNATINGIEQSNAEKRKSNIRFEFENIENLQLVTETPEKIIIDKEQRNAVLEIEKTIDPNSAMGIGFSILRGKEDKEFIELVKKKKNLNKFSWDSFYNKVEPVELIEMVNGYTGIDIASTVRKKVNSIIKTKEKKMAEKAVNVKPIGENVMQKIKVTYPRKKCFMCYYWIPYLNEKKFKPDNCNPTYPSCPVNIYEMSWQFNVKAAAIQLKQLRLKNNGADIKSFMETVPDEKIAEILSVAESISDSEMETVMEEDSKKIDDMDKTELLEFIIDNELHDQVKEISGGKSITSLSEEELKECLNELSQYTDEDDYSDSAGINDDDDDDSAVIGDIKPIEDD